MATPEQWTRVKEIVGGALELDPAVRAGFVTCACAGDVALRDEVDSLLMAHAGAGDLSVLPFAQFNCKDDPEAVQAQRMVGPYRLERELGTGGMGQVWLAEQIEPVRRWIALKLIRGGMFDVAMLQRFRAEQQSLAMMNHPAIAKVFDAGTTPAGQPWFAMEYVEGEPITVYCDAKRLGIGARLGLFLQVCDGVQHAHRKAIIHRDLKPSNILVVEVEGKAQPRIIDFGLAKAAVPLADGAPDMTQLGAVMGTPGYMSPEQADPALDVDTRSDVYALGVLLYELLTGCLPLEAGRKKLPLDEVLRELRETDPTRPSTRVSGSVAAAELRGMDRRRLARRLRGDLDWITMRALEKDRERRYGSAADLAADVERHLGNQPVEARPASRAYRLRKYMRRNRASLAVGGGLFVLLGTFGVVQTVQLRRITRERDRADRVTSFMTGMFNVSDPSEARGNSITAREILDKSAAGIDSELANDPDMRAQMMDTMGQVYDSLGLYPQAEKLLGKSLEIRRGLFGADGTLTLQSQEDYGYVQFEQGRFKDAEKLQRQTVAARRKVLGAQDANTLASMSNLAATLDAEGRYAEAAAMERETLTLQREVMGPEQEDTLTTMNNLANSLTLSDRYAEAEQLERETLAIQTQTLGAEHPDTLRSASNIANTMFQEGRLAEAEGAGRQVVAAQSRVEGAEHPDVLVSTNNLADVLMREGKLGEAEQMARHTLEVRWRVLGPGHRRTLLSMATLGETLVREGHFLEAEKLLTQALDGQLEAVGEAHRDTANTLYALALLRLRQVRKDDALALLERAVAGGMPAEDAKKLGSDGALAALHGDARFAALVEQARERSDR